MTVDITLAPDDEKNLDCASAVEVDGKRCAFASKMERNKGAMKDATTLRPYLTTDSKKMLAAGMWSGPAAAPGKRPTQRFTFQCKFKIEALIAKPIIRWSQTSPWSEQDDNWPAGSVTDCKLLR